MKLNELRDNEGAVKDRMRVARGIGSGKGKTGGRGVKGQKSRSGGTVKPGFEGGQMPVQRRLPKFGFTSQKALLREEVRLSELAKVSSDVVDLDALKAAGVIRRTTRTAKVVLSGEISKAVTLKGVAATKGAKAAIEAAGGKVEE